MPDTDDTTQDTTTQGSLGSNGPKNPITFGDFVSQKPREIEIAPVN